MAESAINRNTGELETATEIRKKGIDPAGSWVCPSCGVDMIPVSCRDRGYKMKPHLRAKGGHKSDCDLDGKSKQSPKRKSEPTGRTRPQTEEWPSSLEPPPYRYHRPPDGSAPKVESFERIFDLGGDAPAGSGTQKNVAKSISRVVEFWISFPQERGRILRLKGCPDESYATRFEKCSESGGFSDNPCRIRYAPIRFVNSDLENDIFVLYMNRFLPSSQETSHKKNGKDFYRIELDLRRFTEGTRKWYRRQWRAAVEIQKTLWLGGRGEEVYAFFRGERDSNDPARFVVRDPRLVCFMELTPDDKKKF